MVSGLGVVEGIVRNKGHDPVVVAREHEGKPRQQDQAAEACGGYLVEPLCDSDFSGKLSCLLQNPCALKGLAEEKTVHVSGEIRVLRIGLHATSRKAN
ncbi:hypothetical protein MK280_06930 [Myxococcota bacterium]|nr:hypothetical protein [Myxococcota bacterium]